MSGTSKIRMRVVECSSEDPDYPASQLNEVSPTTKGWQSVRFCHYPQELGFELIDGEVSIRQIQLLSHQSKISSKIEIFTGTGSSYETATFKRLGYLSLDSNEKSNYQARELKTVHVNALASFFKLLVFENHLNKANAFNQVGIVGLSLMGSGDDDAKPSAAGRGPGDKESAKAVYRNPYYDLTVDISLDPTTASKLRQLAEAKAKAIANEDYGTAKAIKTAEQDLKALGSRLAQLDMAKAEAVANEDYDYAKEIKDEADQLRVAIEHKIQEIRIPGVALSAVLLPNRKVKSQATMQAEALQQQQQQQQQHEEDGEPEVRIKNIDDMPVGGGKGFGQSPRGMGMDSYSTNGKRAVKVEPVEHPGFEHMSPTAAGAAEDEHPDIMERPIRTKGVGEGVGVGMGMGTFSEKDMFGPDGEGADGAANGSSTGMPVERFPPGEHPLEGVPGFADLPTPEMLTSKGREYCETHGITRLLGEYRARCLFSKNWNVREGCMTKVQKLLLTEIGHDPGAFSSALPALGAVLKLGAEDKIQQVMFSAMALLDSVLKEAKVNKLSKGAVVPALEAAVIQLVDKLADGNARLREGARKGIDLVAASSAMGPHPVAVQLVKPLPAKQKTGWRPLATRLTVLADLVSSYGLSSATGLQMDSLLNFPKTAGAYAHSNKEVRDAAKDLVVAIQQQVGTPPLEPTLALLRKNQREEYEAAFEANAKHSKASAARDDSPPRRTDKQHQHATHNPGGKVPTSSNKVQQQKEGYGASPPPKGKGKGAAAHHEDEGEGEGEAPEFTSCMFCGVQNKAWQENDLDLHYWKDCPLLISCPSCAQIVEIAGLPEHLLDECDAKSSYVPCEVTGLAIRASDYDKWKRSDKCVAASSNYMYCPLCYSSVEDSDDAWMTHLTKKCPKNIRIQSG